MKLIIKYIRRFVAIIGLFVALTGVLIVNWPSMILFWLISGRIQPDFETPSIPAAIMLLIIGLFALVVGYMAYRILAKTRNLKCN